MPSREFNINVLRNLPILPLSNAMELPAKLPPHNWNGVIYTVNREWATNDEMDLDIVLRMQGKLVQQRSLAEELEKLLGESARRRYEDYWKQFSASIWSASLLEPSHKRRS